MIPGQVTQVLQRVLRGEGGGREVVVVPMGVAAARVGQAAAAISRCDGTHGHRRAVVLVATDR